MRKLLRANFRRLFRDRVFFLACAVMCLAGALLPVLHAVDNWKNGEAWTPDATCFVYAFLVPILLSFVTALFVGNEYSDGTMRNKLVVGHQRAHVYLANLVACTVAGFLLCLAYLVPHTCLSLLLLGGFASAVRELLLYGCLLFALMAAFAALYVLIAMLCRRRAYSTVGCILLVFALLFTGIRITAALQEPEYYAGYSYTENGVTTVEEPEKNHNYPSGGKRRLYTFLKDCLPGGQAIQLANMQAERPALLAICDGMLLLAATSCGILFFRRRDLQ